MDPLAQHDPTTRSQVYRTLYVITRPQHNGRSRTSPPTGNAPICEGFTKQAACNLRRDGDSGCPSESLAAESIDREVESIHLSLICLV